jgi:hypothetical protein
MFALDWTSARVIIGREVRPSVYGVAETTVIGRERVTHAR